MIARITGGYGADIWPDDVGRHLGAGSSSGTRRTDRAGTGSGLGDPVRTAAGSRKNRGAEFRSELGCADPSRCGGSDAIFQSSPPHPPSQRVADVTYVERMETT